MAQKPRPLPNKILQKDLDDFAALKSIQSFAPSNAAYSVATLTLEHNDMIAKQDLTAQKKSEYEAARDNEIAAQRKFNKSMQGGRTSVKIQFGEDSNEVQTVGLKKKSEYKSKPAKPPKT